MVGLSAIFLKWLGLGPRSSVAFGVGRKQVTSPPQPDSQQKSAAGYCEL